MSEKILQIVAVIASLKKEDFEKGKGPKLAALSAALGFDVTDEERAEAWEKYKADQKAEADRKAAEKKAEAERKAAERKAEQERLAEEKKRKEEEDRLAAEKKKEEPEKKPAFDTAGASCCVTMRNGRPMKVWFRDGKEIGCEDAC